MTEEQLQRAKAVYEMVAERDPSERAALLDEACPDDPEVRAEVEELLSFLPESGDFIEHPPLADPSLFDSIAQSLDAGRLIGNYKVLEEIGRGGMGAVYLAMRADDEFSKQVAIKLVWPGFDSAEVVRRFKQERQILADLDHPNIARLLDGGTTEEGWPYVVMEYVDGVPITDYCDEHQLSVSERLKLFEQVCAAVQYAHRNLVVHRDLKPGNIFVTREGAVKLLDFGIAKILDPSLRADALSLTHTGLYAMTPEYASPEQVRGQNITTASDVYSLGITLYELLTGVHPYRFKTRVLHEMLRAVCEDEPARPSLVCSPAFRRKLGILPPEGGTTNSENLRRRLQGDLDNIILKAMRKEPAQRYDSVEQLSQDIARHLAGEPVIAQGLTMSYRAGRLIRRHWAAVTIAVLLSLLLIGGAVIAQRRARRERWRNYVADMRQAGQYWADGNLARLGDLLDLHGPGSVDDEWRGFEWYCLWNLLHRERLTLQHQSWVYSLAYSADGRKLFTTAREGKIETWDAITGQRLGTFGDQPGIPHPISISRDGHRLATGDYGGIAKVWEVATGRALAEFRVSSKGIHVSLSPDGNILGASGDDGVKLWDVATGQLSHTISMPAVKYFRFSPDGMLLAVGSNNGELDLWDVRSRQQVASLPTGSDRTSITSLAFSPDGRRLYAGGRDGRWRVWDVASHRLLRTVPGHTELIDGLAITRDEKIVATSSDDTTVRLWDAASGQELAVVKNECPISNIAFSPDDRFLAGACMRQMRAKVWEVKTIMSSSFILPIRYEVASVTFYQDGTRLAVNGLARSLWLWDLSTGRQTFHSDSLMGMTPQGELMKYTQDDKGADLQITIGGRIVSTLKGYSNGVSSASSSPDHKIVVAGYEDGRLKLWDLATGQERWSVSGHDGRVSGFAFSPDGRKLVSSSWDHTIRIWDLTTGAEIKRLKGHRSPVGPVLFSPDGKTIASGSWDYTIRLWDAATGRELRTLTGHGNTVWSIAFFPDGKRLASGSDDQTVRIWDIATGDELAALKGHTSTLAAVAISPDGRTLASGSRDGIVRLWRAATEQEVRARSQR